MSQILSRYNLETDIQYVRGIGPDAARKLHKLGIYTLGDLLFYIPRRYEDRSNFLPINKVSPGQIVSLKGKLISLDSRQVHGKTLIIRAAISDGSGAIGLIWFNQKWIRSKLSTYRGELIVYGQVKEGQWGYEITDPEWETIEQSDDPQDFARIMPVYALTSGIGQKTVRNFVRKGLAYVEQLPETLPDSIRKTWNLKDFQYAIKQIHFPDSEEDRLAARRRLVFEEFLTLQLALLDKKSKEGLEEGLPFEIHHNIVETLEKKTTFQLTKAQKRVISEIFADLKKPHPMNRLLQGDVGSGKTIVAAAAILAAAGSNFQSALMAPTEILAEQHFANLKDLLEPLGIRTELLVGKLTKKEKEKANSEIATGKAVLAIGTHALFQEGVNFHKLGLVIVDEQHRFGVMQRGALRAKGFGNPHVLVMTATPIPRSLTLTLYGDLDLSVIDEMPPGRKPIKTHWKTPYERKSVYEGVSKLIDSGAQIYVVCPLVSESEKVLAKAAEDLFKQMKDLFPNKNIGLIHGQMKPKDKENAMNAFRKGETNLMVATPVIEVGVDVPNASVMIIEDANRFGLSQLHQLRGRVGRGDQQSYCVLIGEANTPDSGARLRVMVETNDGFKIAEEDLKIRGPGELYGTRQSGQLELRIADLIQDGKMLEEARRAAHQILQADPQLQNPEHRYLLTNMQQHTQRLTKTDVS